MPYHPDPTMYADAEPAPPAFAPCPENAVPGISCRDYNLVITSAANGGTATVALNQIQGAPIEVIGPEGQSFYTQEGPCQEYVQFIGYGTAGDGSSWTWEMKTSPAGDLITPTTPDTVHGGFYSTYTFTGLCPPTPFAVLVEATNSEGNAQCMTFFTVVDPFTNC